MEFAHPIFLWLLPAIPILWWLMYRRSHREIGTMRFSDVRLLAGIKPSLRIRSRPLLNLLRAITVGLLLVILARPQYAQRSEKVTREGIDIQLALDISLSMKAADFAPKDRITVAKEVLSEFIKNRKDDRIGLVVFSGHAFTQVPLTLDYAFLQNLLAQVETVRRPDGTAIGLALAHSVDGLRNSEAKSKVIILLTDGSNNRGDIEPDEAAEIARAFNVRVYTILAGNPNGQEYPVHDPWRDEDYMIPAPTAEDEVALKQIAERTGGLFFRAGDENALRDIYEKINQLEKTKVDSETLVRYTEGWQPFALAALLVLMLEIALRNTFFRTLS